MTWQPIETAPKDGTVIDLWLNIWASPLSMGMSDAFRVVDAHWRDGQWVHQYKENPFEQLATRYITHWVPIPEPPE